MKLIFPLLFLCQGCVFLLVSLVFYTDITEALSALQEHAGWTAPSFWDWPLVLKIIRVVFTATGGFLVLFGFGAIILSCLRRR